MKAWAIIFFLTGIIFFIFSYNLFFKIKNYMILDRSASALIEKIDIKNHKNKYFQISMSYKFFILDKDYNNFYTYKKKLLNHFTAKEHVKLILKKGATVFYNSKNPGLSSLEKNFPVKEIIYTLITFFIFIYFFFLKKYVLQFHVE